MIVSDNLDKTLFEDTDAKFIQHLLLKDNERIIFSGKFGHGKTTFLKEFFDVKNQQGYFKKQRYNTFFLYPVN